jgi:tetratricopeptide (TPR) repeat protein
MLQRSEFRHFLTVELWTLTLALSATAACARSESGEVHDTTTASPVVVQAVSFLGDSLREIPLNDSTRRAWNAQLAEARRGFDRAPDNADSIIWLGRRLGYLGKFREAIAVYTIGLARYPDNPWLYRHRGHRYISVRELDSAIADLEKATKLVAGKPDEVEPDGQPNAQNRPIGTLQSNIAYHLALAYYLKGDFEKAIPIYERDLKAATNDDRRVSTGHWLYMSLRRLKRDAEAKKLLAQYRKDMEIVENQSYHQLMMLYKGELPVDSVLSPTAPVNSSGSAAVAYGVGNWHQYNGRQAEAEAVYRRIMGGGQWASFGFIAAEAELARMK